MKKFAFVGVLSLCGAMSVLSGCGTSGNSTKVEPSVTDDGHGTPTGDGHAHHGWWCTEHGIPEDVCSMCNSKVAADFQKKGDWCEEHLRAKSQCFQCNPQAKEKFAAEYRAKFGEDPPAIGDET